MENKHWTIEAEEKWLSLLQRGTLLFIRTFAASDLPMTEMMVLQAVANDRSGDIGPAILASKMNESKQNMSAIIARLERRGLIRRKAHPGDRRRVALEPTARGRRVADDFTEKITSADIKFFSQFSKENVMNALGELERFCTLREKAMEAENE